MDQESLRQIGRIFFFYCKRLWLKGFTIVPLGTLFPGQKKFVKKRFRLNYHFLENFDEVNPHLFYSVSVTIAQCFCTETPIFFVYAHNFTNKCAVPERLASLYCTVFSKSFFKCSLLLI